MGSWTNRNIDTEMVRKRYLPDNMITFFGIKKVTWDVLERLLFETYS